MTEKSRRQSFSEAAIVSSIGIIFILVGTYIPFLQLLTFFTAVPYILITMRNGFKYGLMAAVISAVAVLMFSNLFYSLTLLVLFFIPGIAIGYKSRYSKEPFASISWGFVTSIIMAMLYIRLLSVVLGIDIVQETIVIFEQAVSLQKTLGTYPGDVGVDEVKDMIGMIIPGLIVVQAMAMSFFNYYISLLILRRVEGDSRHVPRISEFTLPGNIALGILIIYFLTMSVSGMKWINHEALVANITFTILFMFFLQGFAVLGYFLSKSAMNKVLRNILMVTVLVLGPLSSVVSILGFLDSIIDFRRIRRQQ